MFITPQKGVFIKFSKMDTSSEVIRRKSGSKQSLSDSKKLKINQPLLVQTEIHVIAHDSKHKHLDLHRSQSFCGSYLERPQKSFTFLPTANFQRSTRRASTTSFSGLTSPSRTAFTDLTSSPASGRLVSRSDESLAANRLNANPIRRSTSATSDQSTRSVQLIDLKIEPLIEPILDLRTDLKEDQDIMAKKSSAKTFAFVDQLDNLRALFAISNDTEVFSMNDDIHGEMTLSTLSYRCIQHRYFERLDKIHQLGILHQLHARGNHTRSEHSIGVAYLARKAVRYLREKHACITEKECLIVELAGLFHDLGHGPFSHAFDMFLHMVDYKGPMAEHEARSQALARAIIKDLQASGDPDACKLTNDDLELLEYFIDPKGYAKRVCTSNDTKNERVPSTLPHFTHGIQDIVNNCYCKLDVDKLDYIIRDMHRLGINMGIPYYLESAQNMNRSPLTVESIDIFLRGAMIINETWTFDFKSCNFIVEILSIRRMLHLYVYQTTPACAATLMILDALRCSLNTTQFDKCIDLSINDNREAFCLLTDKNIMLLFLNSNKPELYESKTIIQRFLAGDLYQHVDDFVVIPNEIADEIGIPIEPQEESKSKKMSSFVRVDVHIEDDSSNPMKVLTRLPLHKEGTPEHYTTSKKGVSKVFSRSYHHGF